MRTTIRLEDALLRRAKSTAAASGKSLNDFIADAVRVAVSMKAASSAAYPDLPTFRGQGLQPGIDLDDSAALLDQMGGNFSHARAARPVSRAAERGAAKSR